MSEEQNKDLIRQKEEYEKAAQEAFNRILAAYRLVVDEISDDCFEEVNQVVGKEMNKTFQRAGNAFKEHLFGTIKEKFTRIWKERDMDCNIAMLEIAKNNFVTEEKWRPTNKTSEEQLRPHLIKMMQKQRDLLKKQIQEQKNKINEVIPVLEDMREKMKRRIKQQSEVIAEINADIPIVEEDIKKIDSILNKVNSLTNSS